MKRKHECFVLLFLLAERDCWICSQAYTWNPPHAHTHTHPHAQGRSHKEALRATHYRGDCLRVTLISALVSLSCILISCMQGIAYDLINLPLMNFIILNKTVTTRRHTSPEVNYQPKVFEHSLLVHTYALICIFLIICVDFLCNVIS